MFSFTVEGAAQEMHPIVRDEIYRIGYEAIRNACSHSEGTSVEVDLRYARDLILRVRDNGRGIAPDVLTKGKRDHFGLNGMQERADRMGAKLIFHSKNPGTEVELIVPGNLGFRRQNTRQQSFIAKVRRFLRQ
jgi:signal transduction histidine kinase